METKAVETELTGLMEMGVLQHPGDQDLSGVETLSTKFVLDWRWREEKWHRRARLVARDFAWLDPNHDTFAPAVVRACRGSSRLLLKYEDGSWPRWM